MPNYQFTLKSEEALGAGQYNGIEIGLADGGDAATFSDNLELLCDAHVVSIDERYFDDQSRPYPDGTRRSWRVSLKDADDHWYTFHLGNIEPDADSKVFGADLIAAGVLLPQSGAAAVLCNVLDNNPVA